MRLQKRGPYSTVRIEPQVHHGTQLSVKEEQCSVPKPGNRRVLRRFLCNHRIVHIDRQLRAVPSQWRAEYIFTPVEHVLHFLLGLFNIH